jgi:hypothetical protein
MEFDFAVFPPYAITQPSRGGMTKGPKGPFVMSIAFEFRSEEEIPEQQDDEERNAHQPEDQSPSH